MTWSTLRQRARQLGFDVAYRSRPAEGGGYAPDLAQPPLEEGPWLCVGSYEQTAGVWVHPLTEAARALSPQSVSAAIAGADPFVAPIGGYDAEFSQDFLAVAAPARVALLNPDWGRMPA